MIESIYIKNFGIVEETEFKPFSGFNVITGETGAGKSMIVGAISLLMGQRFGGVLFPNPNKKAVLEMVIGVDESLVKDILIQFEIDAIFPMIIRREINTTGRSRSFINDTPVPINALRDISSLIIDLSEQHENLSLSHREARIELIDDFAGNAELLKNYLQFFKFRKSLQVEIESTENNLFKIKAEQDYLNFQMEELSSLNYQIDEVNSLEDELELLEHAEEVKQSLYGAINLIDREEAGLLQIMDEVIQALKSAANHHKNSASNIERLREISYELKDINSDLERDFENTEFNKERLTEVEERLTLIYKLVKKHNLNNANELGDLREKFESQLKSVDDLEGKLAKLNNQWNENEKSFKKASSELTKARQDSLKKLITEIQSRLMILAMPDSRFLIEIKPSSNCNELGCDEIDFYFSANKGIEPQLLSKVASGGELSRLMLAVKSVLGLKKQLPTLIFDEIDTGISGETASKVGVMMQELSKSAQLIVISHLPQIAARAQYHFLVEKVSDENSTHMHLRKIEKEERVKTLATMLSGDKDSTSAKKTAKEMIGN